MIGLRYWIWIWYGILGLGILGMGSAIYWGRQTQWKNLDEVLRAVGTVTVSLGMLALLRRVGGGIGQMLLVVSLVAFILAFALGRRIEDRRPRSEGEGDEG